MRKIVENYRGTDSWYRKYDDGWIEQGGTVITSIAANSGYWLVFPKPFVNAPLSVRTTAYNQIISNYYGQAFVVNSGSTYPVSNTQVRIWNDGGDTKTGFNWEACGY